MFYALLFLVGGIIFGRLARPALRSLPVNKAVFPAILILLFVMGAQIGFNENIMDNLRIMGWQAACIACAATAGSILLAWLVKRFFRKKHV